MARLVRIELGEVAREGFHDGSVQVAVRHPATAGLEPDNQLAAVESFCEET
ncbi:MAG: hypothetical protein ABSA97_13135 [Verrucomicrobiia bacterium]